MILPRKSQSWADSLVLNFLNSLNIGHFRDSLESGQVDWEAESHSHSSCTHLDPGNFDQNLFLFPICKRRILNSLSCPKIIICSCLESHHWKAAGKMTEDKLAVCPLVPFSLGTNPPLLLTHIKTMGKLTSYRCWGNWGILNNLRVYLSTILLESGNAKPEVVRSVLPTGARGSLYRESAKSNKGHSLIGFNLKLSWMFMIHCPFHFDFITLSHL